MNIYKLSQLVLFLLGLFLVFLSLLADYFGISNPGWSFRQIKFLIYGGFLLLISSFFFLKPNLIRKLIDELIGIFNSILQEKTDKILSIFLFLTTFILGILFYKMVVRMDLYPFFYQFSGQGIRGLGFLREYSIFYGFFYSLSTVAIFLILRNFLGKFLSITGTIMIITSPLHIYNLIPSIMRDYAKAPFILFTILLLICIILKQNTRLRFLCLMSLIGITIGLGSVFRKDIIIMFVPIIICIIIMQNFKKKIFFRNIFGFFLSLIFFLITYTFMIVDNNDDLNRGGFNAVAGLPNYFNYRMNIDETQNYVWSTSGYDTYTLAISNTQYIKDLQNKFTSENDYDFYGRKQINYWLTILTNFPADVLTRFYASSLKIIEMPFMYNYLPFPSDNFLKYFYILRGKLNNFLVPFSLFFVIFSITILSTISLRIALCFLFIILFLSGYPSIQFYGRHYFHLEIISWGSFLFFLKICIPKILNFIKFKKYNP